MNTQTRSHPVYILAAFLALTVLFTSACSTFALKPPLGDFPQKMEISLDEQMFLNAKPTFQVHNHDFWDDFDVDVDRMELHDGFIRFLGTQRQADGSMADCTFDVTLEAEDGGLTARIISLDVPGMTLSDPLVVSVNQDLEAILTTYSLGVGIEFQEVEVTEDALRLNVLVNIHL